MNIKIALLSVIILVGFMEQASAFGTHNLYIKLNDDRLSFSGSVGIVLTQFIDTYSAEAVMVSNKEYSMVFTGPFADDDKNNYVCKREHCYFAGYVNVSLNNNGQQEATCQIFFGMAWETFPEVWIAGHYGVPLSGKTSKCNSHVVTFDGDYTWSIGSNNSVGKSEPKIWNTKRTVDYHGDECATAADCISIHAPKLTLGDQETKNLTLECPKEYPHAGRWDTKQHEHVSISLEKRSGSLLTLKASNQTRKPGSVLAYVGCSKQPPDFSSTGEMLSRSGLPSKMLKSRR